MSTTAEKLNKLLNTKTDIASALEEKGQEGGTVFSTYADQIRNIPSDLIITDDGEGNVAFEMDMGTTTTFQSDWNQDDPSAPNYIKNKPQFDNMVTTDDLATTTTPGLVMVDGTAGIGVNTENGNLFIKEAETNEIDGKEHSYKPITPNNLDYAVKAALVNNANTLSDAEKTAVQQFIGVTDLMSSGCQIAYGTYTGTGTSGKTGACSLTFDFMPQIIFIKSTGQTFAIVWNHPDCATTATTSGSYVNEDAYFLTVSRSGNTISWYSGSDASKQMNSTNGKYFYVCIG